MAAPQGSRRIPRFFSYQVARALGSFFALKKTPPIPVTLGVDSSTFDLETAVGFGSLLLMDEFSFAQLALDDVERIRFAENIIIADDKAIFFIL